MNIKKFCKKGVSLLLSCIFAASFALNSGLAVSAEESETVASPDTAAQAIDDNGVLSLHWKDSSTGDTLSDKYDIVSDSSSQRAITLTASYNINSVREQGYKRGELSIKVKGIGDIYRKSTMKANVAADEGSASLSSDKDWSYTWDSSTDTYTFVNNHNIKGNSRLDGYFDLIWDINPRDSINGYSQNDVKAVMKMSNDQNVESNVLSITNKTTCDKHTSSITPERLNSLDGIDLSADDYIFVKYFLSADVIEKARGVQSCSYVFNADTDGVGKDIILYNGSTSMETLDDNKYTIGNYTKFDKYIYIAYPKEYYRGKTVNVSLTGTGRYYDEDSNVIVSTRNKTIMLSDYDGIIIYGNRYNFEFCHNSGDLDGSKISDGLSTTYRSDMYLYQLDSNGSAFEIYNDLYYGRQNNGVCRQLTSDEYNISYVIIPSVSNTRNVNGFPIKPDIYDVKVYAATNGENITVSDDMLVYSGKLTNNSHTVNFPANTTSYCIRVENLTETIGVPLWLHGLSFYSSVNFHFGDQSDIDEDNQLDIHSGMVYAFSAMKIYDYYKVDGKWIEKWTDGFSRPDIYEDYAGLDIVNKTHELYDGYPYRSSVATPVKHIRFEDKYSAISELLSVSHYNDKYRVDVTMGIDYSYYETTPHKFSVSTVLPDNMSIADYSVPEQLWDLVSVSGLGLSEDELIAHCTPEIDGQNISFNFDFGDKVLPSDSKLEIKFTCAISRSSIANVRSVVLTLRTDASVDSYHTSQTGITRYINPSAAQLQLVKYVKTEYNNDYESLPAESRVSFGGNYSYMLELINGGSEFTNVIIKDILDKADGSDWQGQLQSVSISSKINGIVYFSESDNPNDDLSSSDWAIDTDINKVKAIAVNFGSNVLKPGQVIDITVNMKATDDKNLKNKAARNKCSASVTEYITNSDIEPAVFDLTSNVTSVSVTSKLRNLIVTKEDAVNGDEVSGAKFELRNKDTGKIVATKTTNGSGNIVFSKLPTDVEYILKETGAPTGYILSDDEYAIKFGDEDYRLTITNERKLGAVKVYKTNSLADDVAVPGATYALIDSNGKTVKTEVTDDLGVALFSDLDWGTYTVKEIASPAGYKLNDTEYKATVSKSTLDAPVGVYATDEQTNNINVKLTKYEACVDGSETDIVLANAQFKLSRITKVGSVPVGKYTTDANGEITVNNLAYGQYVFTEVKAPTGFNYCSDVRFSVDADTKDLNLTAYDTRKAGSIEIFKTITTGDVASDCEFKLYDKTTNEVVATSVTDEYGHIRFNGLDWGSYYFKETSCPDYYILNENIYDVTISGTNLSQSFDVKNDVVKGSVVLTKTNEIGNAKLKDAVFNLYKNDGTLVSSDLTTDENGQIKVDNLDWGIYYFKEITAPAGYVASDSNIRFAVNKDTAVVTQELMMSNALDADSNARTIVITKKIKADDINFDNGNPSFLFTIHTDKDIYNKAHTYHRLVSFDKRYVEANVDSNGYVSQSVFVSGIPAGNYTVSEQNSQRYKTTNISDITNGSVIENTNDVLFNLTDNMRATATLTSVCYDYRNYSDNSALSNMLRKNSKYVGLKAIWTGDDTLVPNEAFDLDYLTVKAIYDDGSTKVVDTNACTLDMTAAPTFNGQYQVNVSYTENGITHTAVFNIIADYGAVMTRIIASPRGIVSDYIIGQGDSISVDDFIVTGLYSDGTSRVLNTDEYDIDKTVAPADEAGVDVPVTITADDKFTPVGATKRLSTVVTLVTDAPRAEVYEIGTPVASDVIAIMYADDTMVIKGEGAMQDWNYHATPWYNSPYRQTVTSCVIQDGITNTGEALLQAFTSLKTVTMPDSIINIGTCTFDECSVLNNVIIPDKVESIGHSVFRDCSSLESIVIPDSVVSIGNYIFSRCSSLSDVTIGKGLTELSGGMFSDCTSLESLVIPDNIVSIGRSGSDGTFWGCDNLLNIVFSNNLLHLVNDSIDDTAWYDAQPDGVVYINDIAYSLKNYSSWDNLHDTLIFKDGTKVIHSTGDSNYCIYNVILPDSVEIIDSYAFHGLYGLRTINFGKGLKYIGARAFYYCENLTAVDIPDGIEEIGEYAFSGCRGLKSVHIGKGDTFIGCEAFGYNQEIESLIIDGGAKIIDKQAFYDAGSYLGDSDVDFMTFSLGDGIKEIREEAFGYCGIKDLVIPDSVEIIGSRAFSGNNKLESLSLPKGLKTIGDYAFNYCKNLKSVDIPDGITTIGHGMFCGCSSLDNLVIPDSVTTIGSYAFETCDSLVSVDISAFVTSIGTCAFSGKNLVSINVDKDNENYCDIDGVLFTKDKKSLIVYPSAKGDVYTIPDGVITVCTNAFDNSNVVTVNVPDSVEEIGSRAFDYCSSLKSINFGNGLKSIGTYAFCDCSSLESIVIPDSVENIGSSAFSNCSSLESIVIPNSVESIQDYVFTSCTNLKSVDFGTGVKTISSYAFDDCSSLESIIIPDNVESIQGYAFDRCTNLTSVTFGGGIKRLGRVFGWSFENLTNVVLPQGFNIDYNHHDDDPDYDYYCFDLSDSTQYSTETIVSWLECLADRTGQETYTFSIGSKNIAKLSEEQKAIATNKNWVLQ